MLEPRNEPMPDALNLPDLEGDDAPTLPEMGRMQRALPWWRTRWARVSGPVLLFVLLVGAIFGVLRALRQQVTYQTQRATSGDLALTISAAGPLQTSVYAVTLPSGSKITAIKVKVGDQVTAGQTLATLDSTALQDAVNLAQAAVNSAQKSLDGAQNNVSNVQAQTDAQVAAAFDQEQNAVYQCHHEQNPPPNCVQQAQDQYASAQAQATAQNAQAQAQANSAQAQLSAAQAQLQMAQHNLANASVTSPHAGTVAAINGAVGGEVTSGTGSTGTAFISIADLSSVQVLAAVNEADIGGVAPGDPISFTVSALPSRVFHGTVSTMSPLGQTVQNVVTYPVTINVDTAGVNKANLLPGMTARVTITSAQRFHVLLIPVSAVTFARGASNPQGLHALTQARVQSALLAARQMIDQLTSNGVDLSNDSPQPAFVLERSKSGWVVKPVVLGLTNGTVYEVLAGLSEHEAVVTGAVNAAGTPVTGTSRGSGGLFRGGA
jgi:HlyD family secretion protein